LSDKPERLGVDCGHAPAPRRHGQGGLTPFPCKCRKVLFVLQMFSKVSVVFMYYFEKMSWASGGFAPGPTGDPTGGLPSFRAPHCPPCGRR